MYIGCLCLDAEQGHRAVSHDDFIAHESCIMRTNVSKNNFLLMLKGAIKSQLSWRSSSLLRDHVCSGSILSLNIENTDDEIIFILSD